MRFGAEEFRKFWDLAARSDPVVIVGAGRWGRVWAGVLSGARGGGAGSVIVARHNLDETRQWAARTVPGLGVESDIETAIRRSGAQIAIIASRPADHVRDARTAISAGAHVLVEKPISDRPADASRLAGQAREASLRLGVGIEFAMHPAVHFLAERMALAEAADIGVALTWTDPRGEVRHGARKTAHSEISVLDDIMPHGLSIFRVVRPQAEFALTDCAVERDARRGWLALADGQGGTYRLTCDSESDRRRRLLELRIGDRIGSLDFAAHPPAVSIDGDPVAIPPSLLVFDSTLRLEFGAFLAEASGLIETSPLTTRIDEMIALHAAMADRGC